MTLSINSYTDSTFSRLLICLTVLLSTPAWSQSPSVVETVLPQQIEQKQSIELTGTIQSKHHAQLASLAAGRVDELLVEVGDLVNQGQVLLTLDDQMAQLEVAGAAAEVKAAQLNLDEAKRLYEEVKKLSAQKVVAKTLIAERAALLASAEVELARVEANHSLAKERLSRYHLKAPFAGVVAFRNVDVGEWVNSQNPVLTLVDQNDLRLAVQIPQQHYAAFKTPKSIQALITADATDAVTFEAPLSRLVPVLNQQTRTFTAQIDVPETHSNALVPGMSANVALQFPNSTSSVILLPQSAVKQHPDGNSSVFVVENNRAKRIVTAFKQLPNKQVAIKGLPANQPYIVKGVELLKDGDLVFVNNKPTENHD